MINQNKIEFAVLNLIEKFFFFIGLKSSRKVGYLFSTFIYYFIPIRKKIVLKNLSIAFPSFSQKQIKNIALKNYRSIFLTLIEFMFLSRMTEEELKSIMFCENFDLIREKYEKGKGLILLTAHFGNWEVGAVSTGSHLAKTIHVLAKDQRNPFVTKWLNSKREKFGNKVVPLGASVRDIYKVIRNKGMVGLVGDQRGPKDGHRVKFFNQDTAVYPGTAAIALKTGTPILTVFTKRQDNYKYELFVEEIPTDNLSGDDNEKIMKINQKYMNILETRISEAPEQWFWMHNIWKY